MKLRRLTRFAPVLFVVLMACGFQANAEEGGQADAVEKLDDGRIRIGEVLVDAGARSVSFPAKVNMDAGYLEYLLVTERGKKHESLLSTAARPVNLHAAMLLLGVKGSPASCVEGGTAHEKPARIDAEFLATAKLPTGDPVMLTVTWAGEDGTPRSAPAEDWLIDEARNRPAGRGPWIYNGSEILRGHFVAESDGSVVALIRDPVALINNPREGNDNDLIWKPNAGTVPPVGTPVTVTITIAIDARASTEPTPFP